MSLLLAEDVIEEAAELVRARKRITARALQTALSLSDAALVAVRAELVTARRVAIEREGVLEWRGDSAPPAKRSERERRVITVLFSDLVGSTQLAGQLDPEDFHDVLRRYQACTAEVVERFDGYVAQYLGDGVLVYFGWPTAHEDDAVRAVSAAMKLVGAIDALSESLASAGLPAIQVRVGVHTGPVVVGEVGGGHRFESLALGETPNVGARLQAEAGANEVVVSEETRRLVEGYFTFRDLGARELRGVTRHVQLFAVLGASGARGRIEAAAARGLTPLVDRERERDALKDAYERAKGGARSAVLVRGEAGIGKSRLLHYVTQTLATGDRALLECRCSPLYTDTALHPIAEALAIAWDVDRAPDPIARVEAIAQRHPALAVEESTALLALLLGVPLDDARAAPIAVWTPQRRRAQTFQLIVDLVRLEATERPVIFVVEDLHWVDPSTSELLDALLGGTRGSAVFFLMTARPGPSLFESRSDVLVIDLPRFGRDHAAELVRSAAGVANLSAAVTDRLTERTDGVPFFIEELTRTVIDAATAHDDTAALSERILRASIPTTVYGCLMARLDRNDLARTVSQLGAALGRTFSRALLRAVSDLGDAALDEGLAQAVEAQILQRTVAQGEAVYSFRHALIQEAALESVLKRTRQQLHARIADALVSRFAPLAAKEPERVASHFASAELWPHAAEWWTKAGLTALARFANAEALAHFTRAVGATERLPDGPARDASELALRVLSAIPLTMSRGWTAPEVVAQYRRAEELCGKVGDAPQLFPTLSGLLTYLIVSGQYARAAEMGARNLAIAETANDDELRLEARVDLGNTLVYLGRIDEALAQLDAALALYAPEKHHAHVMLYGKEPGAVGMVHAALANAVAGRIDQARQITRAATAITDRWPHPFTRLWTLCGQCCVEDIAGDVDASLPIARVVVEESQAQGFPNWLAQGLCYLGYATARAGDHAAGIEQLRKGLGIWQATGAALLRPFLHTLLADALFVAGDHASAIGELDTAIELAERTGEKWYFAEMLRLRGEIVRASGTGDPRVWFERALADARERGAHLHVQAALSSLSRLDS